MGMSLIEIRENIDCLKQLSELLLRLKELGFEKINIDEAVEAILLYHALKRRFAKYNVSPKMIVNYILKIAEDAPFLAEIITWNLVEKRFGVKFIKQKWTSPIDFVSEDRRIYVEVKHIEGLKEDPTLSFRQIKAFLKRIRSNANVFLSIFVPEKDELFLVKLNNIAGDLEEVEKSTNKSNAIRKFSRKLLKYVEQKRATYISQKHLHKKGKASVEELLTKREKLGWIEYFPNISKYHAKKHSQ